MNEADKIILKHKELTHTIIGVYYDVYNELGHGFLESVYQRSLAMALQSSGLQIRSQVKIPVWFRGQRVGQFEGDLLVNDEVLLELKATRCLDLSHSAQILNYLRATDIEVGLLLNFGLKPEFKRFLLENSRKANRAVTSG
ncbi:MAG TPA: GxxExxY protein [Pyrinomonadaceae bacterium]|nr:GxxExxY protein [Pyrinomonadaceae bacterium]